ncbi:MAG: recJ [Clostridiales bacterium]|nr:recJ [Clostridiales bacterium]
MLNSKEWVYKNVSEEKVKKLAEQAGISTLLAKVFVNRGINDIPFIQKFLNPSTEFMHDPYLLKDMEPAVIRIIKAINEGEKILVYGDYDVDGITSTSILSDFLTKQKANVDFYIPDRMDDGYGLSIGAIDKIIKLDVSLIITVDCGVTAVDEVKYIKENNIDIIITDHHQCKEKIPECDAIINPCRPDCEYPFKQLAGVGVVFKLIHALCIRMGIDGYQNRYGDLVALGTIADVVPLIDENRVIVKLGISMLEKTQNIGLRALIDNSGLKDKTITSTGVSFILAPRINAAGRIGDAGRAVRLFTTQSDEEALNLALELNEENKFRQDTEIGILQEVLNAIESQVDLNREKVIVVGGEGWHHGIIGIVASKVTERFYRPCILIDNNEGIGKGSGRSIEGFNLFNALNYCKDLLDKFGGHELAAGLTIKTENIQEMRRRINNFADEIMDENDLIPKLKIDVNVSKNDLSIQNVRELDLLAPFGAGNPGPLFVYNGLKVSDIRTVGENKHLKLKLEDGGLYLDAIGFNMAAFTEQLTNKPMIEVACQLEVNVWNSVEKVQLNLKDLRPNNKKTLEDSYYSSLEKTLKLDAVYPNEVSKAKRILTTEEQFIEFVCNASRENIRTAILANSFQGLGLLDEILKKSAAGIKKRVEICYTNSYDYNSNVLYPIINPDIEAINLDAFDQIVIIVPWVDSEGLTMLLSRADNNKIIYYGDNKIKKDEIDNIIPGRTDLVTVYQFLRDLFKTSNKSTMKIYDMSELAHRIEEAYNAEMNCFKLKICLEIFEELNFLKFENIREHEVSIDFNNGIKNKVDLESSKLYSRLQKIKANFK